MGIEEQVSSLRVMQEKMADVSVRCNRRLILAKVGGLKPCD